jgi:hypothetical protein
VVGSNLRQQQQRATSSQQPAPAPSGIATNRRHQMPSTNTVNQCQQPSQQPMVILNTT